MQRNYLTYKITEGGGMVLTIFTNKTLISKFKDTSVDKYYSKKCKRRGEFESPGRYFCRDTI